MPSADNFLYQCFSFHLRSEIALPELNSPTTASGDVVEISRGQVPLMLEGAGPATYGLQNASDIALLSVPRTARYLIRGGRTMIVDRLPGASQRNVRLFTLGSALAVLCYQRGMLLLHANALHVGDYAVAVCGPSGAGKSTLAAAFERRGFPVLCDDVCGLSFDPLGQPFVWPGAPRLKLWADTAVRLGHDPAKLDLAIEGQTKYLVPLSSPSAGPLPLKRLYVIDSRYEAVPAIRRLRGACALEAVMANSYRGAYLDPMGLEASHFRQCLSLLSSVDVFTVGRRWGIESFDSEIARLEAHMTGSAQ